MSDRLLLVEKFEIEYGSQVFDSYDIRALKNYLVKLEKFGVNTWVAEDIYVGLMVCAEIEADGFREFYQDYIQSQKYKEEEDKDKKLNEQEVEVSHRISNLLQTNPNYINERGYIAIAYI